MPGNSDENQLDLENAGKPAVLVVVAHPDDETLWTGGTILMHPKWSWTIVCLTRGSDPDRAPKFLAALERYGASGKMADLDDGPEQKPLAIDLVEETVLSLLESKTYDRILTHGRWGEYTRHLRHEETGRAVVSLWRRKEITAASLWRFAYQDHQKTVLPQAEANADRFVSLPDQIWQEKYAVITRLYGFSAESWEARTTPRQEAFWNNPLNDKF